MATLSSILSTPSIARGQSGLPLGIRTAEAGVEIDWPAKIKPAVAGTVIARYEIQTSADLVGWKTLDRVIPAATAPTDGRLRFLASAQGGSMFYRVVGIVQASGADTGGADVFGYTSAFADEVARIGQISAEQFAQRYSLTNEYLDHIASDPTAAEFWDAFNVDPAVYNQTPAGKIEPRLYDFRLSAAELAVFKQYGFVVSERQSGPSFADIFYRIYSSSLPVFVTTDAILQAWHRSYLGMLEELEETYLSSTLEQIANAMAAQLPDTWSRYGKGPLRESILDANYFLTVLRSLQAGQQMPTYLRQGQDPRVAATLTAISALQLQDIDLFGTMRTVDFSQFKPRGNYDSSERLRRYFRAMMWAGRIDFRVAGDTNENTIRELGSAIVLNHLLNRAGQFDQWLQFNRVLEVFVGLTDSMTFAQLGDVLAAANIRSPADLPDATALTNLQNAVLGGQVGVQNIRGDYFVSPMSPEQLQLPRSFTVCGQKFVLDSWALAQTVFDRIIWDTNGVPEFTDKVERRIPSCLDAAFAALGNSQIVPELVARMTNTAGRQFRDGLPYQHNLAAVRNVIDRQAPETWADNLYLGWLGVLRELSVPTTGPEYPECLRTRAWAMKTLNTQLASWTQLRHDTILYAKPSYTAGTVCSYPAGFVEPRLSFWRRMTNLTARAANLIGSVPMQGLMWLEDRQNPAVKWPVYLDDIQRKQTAFLNNFAGTMTALLNIAGKQLAQQPLSSNETNFLKSLIEWYTEPYTGIKRYSGWYPALFYQNVLQTSNSGTTQPSDRWDALVADVHTDVPDDYTLDPGCVLHEGVGNVNLLIVAVDNGPDHMVYAGPVLSHYEFEMPGVARKSDTEWKADIRNRVLPPHPDWTQSYLVPAPYTVPAGYQ